VPNDQIASTNFPEAPVSVASAD